jgi:glycosyltransferase involved in cell wall biosynthesis
MKQVLVITYYWPPSGGPGVQRWLKFVKYFHQFNVFPHVLTVSPENASYAVTDENLQKDLTNIPHQVYYTKTFEPFNFYKKITRKNEIPFSGFANESKPNLIQKIGRFVRGNFFIPDARVGWNTFALDKAIEIIEKENIKTVFISSPPHSSQLIGLALKKKFPHINWIADLRDPWTNIYYYKEMMHLPFAKKKDKNLEKEVLLNADHLITVSESLKKDFIKLAPQINNEKFEVIPNGFDIDDMKNLERKTTDSFSIVYTGTLSGKYLSGGFFNAFNKLTESESINLKMIGKIDEQFMKQLNKNNVQLLSYMPHQESLKHLVNSSMALLIIPNIAENKGILTGKLFEYLMAKIPILAIGPTDGDAAKIMEECNAGKMFDYEDEIGIIDFISSHYNKWKNDKNYFSGGNVEIYSRKELTARLSKLIV